MKSAEYAARYIRCIFSVLAAAYGVAQRWDMATHNPCVNATLPKLGHTAVRPPTSQAVKDGMELARDADPAMYVLLRICFVGGLRRSEALGLQREDVVGGRLTVQRVVLSAKGGAVVQETTKSERGHRIVSVDAETARLIYAHALGSEDQDAADALAASVV